ncbi:unnamed protein product, partial [Chrysoparadoxa australica]
DPCVFCFWEGQEVGRTKIVKSSLNPIFHKETNVFRLPIKPLGGFGKKGISAAEYQPELRLEVWDMDRNPLKRSWDKGEFL